MKNRKFLLSALGPCVEFCFDFSKIRYGVIFACSDYILITDGIREYSIPQIIADHLTVKIMRFWK